MTDAWRSRIVGHGMEQPDQLLANPNNWRVHSKRQQDALGEVLDEVGWVQGVIVNRTTGHVVDGHLRVALALSRDEREIPVDYVDLSEREEGIVLATLDPLAALAVTDSAQLLSLFSSLDLGGELDKLVRETAGMASASRANIGAGDVDRAQEDLMGSLAGRGQEGQVFVSCPHCGQEFGVNRDELSEAPDGSNRFSVGS